MRYLTRVVLGLGGTELICEVAETPADQAHGLQGRSFLLDSEGMYFPLLQPPVVGPSWPATEFTMARVSFPIDIIFFRGGLVSKVVGNIPPGHQGRWSQQSCSGVLEVRGGWARDHLLQLGTPLIASLGAWGGGC